MIATQQLVIFRPNLHQDIKDSFHSVQWLNNMLSDQEWDVGQGRYEIFQNMDIFSQIKRLNVKQFKLRWTRNEQILNNIASISFPHLRELFLNGNSLNSIQAITRINLPSLQNLNLKQNQIMLIGSLRKCNLPSLKQISLYKNKICDAHKLVELNAPKLQKIWFNGRLQDGNIVGTVAWIAKLQSNKVKNLIINHQKRIEEQSAMKALERKSNCQLSVEYTMQDDRGLNWL